MNLSPYRVSDMASSAPFPEGTYRYRIAGFEFNDPRDADWRKEHPKSRSKDPYLQADLVVQDERAEDGTMVFGRHVFTTLSFKKGGDFMLRGLIEACGKEEDWALVDDEGTPHWDELVDGEVMGVTTIQPERVVDGEKYNARNEVRKFLSVFGG